MAKTKFFYNRVYNVKRSIINIVIISVCVIGIIVCFALTSKFKSTDPRDNQSEVDIKNEVAIEINEDFDKEIFFSNIKNIKLDDIKVTYPNNFSTSQIGSYNVIITINDKNYDSTLNVVDTKKPELVVKNVTIDENGRYDSNNFVTSCKDNSNKTCIISFNQDAKDQNGNKIDFASYKKSGVYNVEISAKDESGNEVIKTATLTITGTSKPVTPVTQECKYGNASYDTQNYVVAIFVTSNDCAVSLDLYKDTSLTQKINKLMETETIRIKKDADKLKLKGRFALNRQITVVLNNSGDGIVGYQLAITLNVTNNGESSNVVTYKVNSDGERVFTNNPYDLSK